MSSRTDEDEAPSQEFFLRESGTGDAMWEIKRPQSTIIKLVEQGVFHGEVLDIGCGIADNAIYIAKHGNHLNITAIDLALKAVEVAREKAKHAQINNIQFEVVDLLGDMSKTKLKKNAYDVILDAGVFHLFSNNDRLHIVKDLQYLIKPGGLYIQLCFSEKETREGGPRRMKKSDLEQLFSSANGWTIESIEDSVYETSPDGPLGLDGRAYLSLIRRH